MSSEPVQIFTMNPISLTGAFIVTIAFLLYGIGTISSLRFKMVSPGVLWFLSLGFLLDVTATVFKIIGAPNNLFSLRGIFRYSALLAMLGVVILIWRIYITEKMNAEIGEKMLAFMRVAMSWWIIAYITCTLLVIV